MTVADLINVLLELDQQVIHPRPSEWGKAAELVHALAVAAEPNVCNPGPWKDIDMSSVRRRSPQEIRQPTLDQWQAKHIHSGEFG
jgi:hypothetical protein